MKSLDPMRPVVDNDGWEHTDQTDLMTLHDYARTGEELAKKYAHLDDRPARIPRNGREALVFGAKYNGTPFLMTEFGGIAFRVGRQGRRQRMGLQRNRADAGSLPRAAETAWSRRIRENPAWAGYCYTQLTDVEQEINGLMTYDRKPKADPEVFKKIFAQ